MVFEQLDLLRVLQLEGLEIVKQSLHVMAAFLGHTYAALPNLCYHLVGGTHDLLFPHQLQWRYQHWHVQSMFGDAVRDLLDPRLRGGAGRSSGPRRKRIAARLATRRSLRLKDTAGCAITEAEAANHPYQILGMSRATWATLSGAACFRNGLEEERRNLRIGLLIKELRLEKA